ncbi:MAG: acetylglutamate kinase [Euzebyales bacterium]|nr:acetylglutamate kinase [Euzebyales bacterium]
MSAVTPLTDRTRRAQDKARVLREALPWITRWTGRTLVVKYGGNAMGEGGGDRMGEGGGDRASDSDAGLTGAFAADVALLHRVGLRVVVVHGGGPQISATSQRFGLQPRFVDGRRVTDDATLDIVRMVLLGQVNPALVGRIEAAGAPAAGVSGIDAGLLRARLADGGRLGHVGEVTAVAPKVLTALLDDGVVPVVATLARGEDGGDLNVNADTAAGALAVALGADKLIYLSNVSGLYRDFGTDTQSLLSTIPLDRLRDLLAGGGLHTGMVPKVQSVVAALQGGVAQAHLLDGRVEHALLLEIFTDEGIGTMVTHEGNA